MSTPESNENEPDSNKVGDRELAERIRAIRSKAGLSQDAFGERLGLTRQAIYQYESATRTPNPKTLRQIAREFGEDVGWLFTGVTAEERHAERQAEKKARRQERAEERSLREEIDELREEIGRLRSVMRGETGAPRPNKEHGARYDQSQEVRDLLEGVPEEESGHAVPEPEGVVTEAVLLGVLFELLDEEGFTVDLLIRGRSKRITRSLLRRVVAATEGAPTGEEPAPIDPNHEVKP